MLSCQQTSDRDSNQLKGIAHQLDGDVQDSRSHQGRVLNTQSANRPGHCAAFGSARDSLAPGPRAWRPRSLLSSANQTVNRITPKTSSFQKLRVPIIQVIVLLSAAPYSWTNDLVPPMDTPLCSPPDCPHHYPKDSIFPNINISRLWFAPRLNLSENQHPKTLGHQDYNL